MKSRYLSPAQAYAMRKEGKLIIADSDLPALRLPNGHPCAMRVTRRAAERATRQNPACAAAPWLLSDVFPRARRAA